MKVILAAVLSLGALLIAGSLVPFDFIKSLRADGLPTYSPEQHFRLVWLMRGWGGGLLIFVSAGLVRLAGLRGLIRHFWQDAADLCTTAADVLRSQRLPLAIVGLIAVVVRLPYLHQPMRYDEAYSYLEYASLPLLKGISMYRDPNNHLFNTFLMHMTTAWFGVSAWACRLPALIPGILLAPSCFLCMIRIGKFAAWLAGLAVATNPMLIEYSTTGRGYMLQTLLVVWLFGLTRILLEQSRPVVWCCWSLATALSLWTIPTSLFAVAAVTLQLLICSRFPSRRTGLSSMSSCSVIIGVLAGAVMTVFLYTPVFAYSGFNAVTSNSFVLPKGWAAYCSGIIHAMKEVAAFLFRDQTTGTVGLWTLATAAALLGSAQRSYLRLAAASMFAGTLITVIQRVHPPARVWVFLIPLGLLLAAAGWETLLNPVTGRVRRALLMAAVVGLTCLIPLAKSVRSQSILLSNEGGVFRDAPDVVESLLTLHWPQEPVLAACPAHAPVVFYAIQTSLVRQDFLANWNNQSPTDSVLIVVNFQNFETLHTLREMYHFSNEWRQGDEQVLATYPTGQLVRITRRSPDNINQH